MAKSEIDYATLNIVKVNFLQYHLVCSKAMCQIKWSHAFGLVQIRRKVYMECGASTIKLILLRLFSY